MDVFGIISFTFALPALSIGIMNQMRINNLEKKLKECLKNDRARIQVGRISHFGLMEMSRQRMRASVLESTMQPCPHCGGAGHIRSQQSVALHVIRSLEDYLMRNGKHHITVRTDADTALYILNHKRETLTEMEGRFGLHIEIVSDPMIGSELYAFDKGEISDLPRVEPIRPDYSDFDDDDDIVEEIDQEEEEIGSAVPSEEDVAARAVTRNATKATARILPKPPTRTRMTGTKAAAESASVGVRADVVAAAIAVRSACRTPNRWVRLPI